MSVDPSSKLTHQTTNSWSKWETDKLVCIVVNLNKNRKILQGKELWTAVQKDFPDRGINDLATYFADHVYNHFQKFRDRAYDTALRAEAYHRNWEALTISDNKNRYTLEEELKILEFLNGQGRNPFCREPEIWENLSRELEYQRSPCNLRNYFYFVLLEKLNKKDLKGPLDFQVSMLPIVKFQETQEPIMQGNMDQTPYDSAILNLETESLTAISSVLYLMKSSDSHVKKIREAARTALACLFQANQHITLLEFAPITNSNIH